MILTILTDVAETFWKIIISLVGSIFKLVNSAYRIFLALAEADIFENAEFDIITKNMYEILSIVMLFALAYGILVKIVDPENSKSGVDGKKILQKLVMAIVLLALIPSIFSFMFGLQKAILESKVLNSIFTGSSNVGAENIKNAGNVMAVNSFKPFFTPNVNNDTNPEDARGIIKNHTEYGVTLNNQESYGCKYEECTLAEVDSFAEKTGDFGFYQAFALNIHEGEVDFQWLIALIVGGFLVYAMISFCFDMALRVCKLAFFEIIAPIAIFCNVIPKMEDVFKKWLSNTTKTFISVFTRIIVMNFGVYLISIIVKNVDLGLDDAGNWFLNLIAKCFLILGIVMFMRQAPKLLSDLFGFGDGDMKLGIKDKLKEGGFFALGNAVGSLVTSRGNPLAFIRGAKYGFKNTDMHHVGAEGTRRRAFKNALENSTPGELALDRLRRMFGFESSQEAADLHIENAKFTIKDADGNDITLDVKAIEDLQKHKDKLNTNVSQIADMMRKNQTAKSDNGILLASQDAIKNAAISDLSKSDSEIVESLSIDTGYTDAQKAADLDNLDELYTKPGSDMSYTEYEERRAAIQNRQQMLNINGNYTSLKEQLDTSYRNGLLSNEQYQKASVALAKKQKEMVEKYVTAAATGGKYKDANQVEHDVDKSKKVLSSYNKFVADLTSGNVAHKEDGTFLSKEEGEALEAQYAKGWKLVDEVSKQLGNVNFELEQGLMENERNKRVIEQQIQSIDGQLDQVAKQKQAMKSEDSYRYKSEASKYNDKYHK